MTKELKNKIVSLISPIAFLAFGIWLRLSANGFTKRDAMFPKLVSMAIIVIAVVDLIVELTKKQHKDRFAGVNFLRILMCLVAMFLYVSLLKKIGFFLDTLLLTAFTMWTLDYKNYKVLPVAALVITTIVFVMFKVLLKVPLPTIWL